MTARIPAPPAIPGLAFVRTLGSGSAADVHLYRHDPPESAGDVAVKVSKRTLTPDQAAAFRAEADVMARMTHPRILPVRGSGVTADGHGYIMFDHAPGGTLKDLLATRTLSCERTLDFGVRLAGALETAHRAGVIHHDVKTSNVLLDAHGMPMLSDFGIATDLYDRTFTGYSLPWAAPEVLSGHPGVEAADLYSLAAVLYAALVGTSPFEYGYRPSTPDALRRLILEREVPPIGRADVPAQVERILRRAMAKRPEDRPASALLFARDLQRVQDDLFGAMTPLEVADRPPYPPHGHDSPTAGASVRPAAADGSVAHGRSRRMRVAAAVTAGVAVAAAVAAVFAFVVMPRMDTVDAGSGRVVSDDGAPGASGSRGGANASSPDLLDGEAVPSPTNPRGVVGDDGVAELSWDDPDPQDGDTYLWSPTSSDGGAQSDGDEASEGASDDASEGMSDGASDGAARGAARSVAEPRVRVAVPEGEAGVCVDVWLVRADRRVSAEPLTVCATR